MAFLPIKNPFVWIGLQIIANTIVCIATVAGWAMVSDAIDYQELKTGEREEGFIYATYSMIRKIGQEIGSALVPTSIAFLIPGLDVADASSWSAEYANQIKSYPLYFQCSASSSSSSVTSSSIQLVREKN